MSKRAELRKVLSLITELTCKIMRVDRCSIELRGRKTKELIPIASYGLSISYLKLCLSIPIMNNGIIIGEVKIYTKKKREFTEEEIRFMTKFSSQTAFCVQEIDLTEDVNKNYFNTVFTLVTAIEEKDQFIKGHSRRVTDYAIRAAQRLGLNEERIKKIEILYYSGELHDIGKIGISEKILNKPGKLTEAEYEVVKFHPVKGAQILKPLKFLEESLPIVRHHHERFDGKGYPDRLEGERIPLEARILACADAFDAMTYKRPYRKKRLTLQEAIEELRDNSGTQFDPEVVRAFTEILPKEAEITS